MTPTFLSYLLGQHELGTGEACFPSRLWQSQIPKDTIKLYNAREMNIHNKVKEYRVSKGVTQEELAETVSVSRQTIIAIEKGNYTPSLMLAMQIAKFFKTSIEEIFILK